MQNKNLIIAAVSAVVTALVTRKIVRYVDGRKLDRKMRELDERLDHYDDYDYED